MMYGVCGFTWRQCERSQFLVEIILHHAAYSCEQNPVLLYAHCAGTDLTTFDLPASLGHNFNLDLN